MILDVIACGLVVLFEIVATFIIAVLIQGTVYRTTGFSIWNYAMEGMKKEIAPYKVLSLKK